MDAAALRAAAPSDDAPREAIPIEAKTRKQLNRQLDQFKAVWRTVSGYPRKAYAEFAPGKPLGTHLMALLVLVYAFLVLVFFYNHAWKHVVRPWDGKVVAKDARVSQIGQNQVTNWILLVERPDGVRSEYSVASAFYAAANMGDPVVKPFLYSRIHRPGDGREAAVQLRDLFLLAVSLILCYLAAVCGGSFVAVLFVSLFLHDPRKNRKR